MRYLRTFSRGIIFRETVFFAFSDGKKGKKRAKKKKNEKKTKKNAKRA